MTSTRAIETPGLMRRLQPLLLAGYVIAAIRLGLDFWDRESAMLFGLYYAIPVVIAWIGLTRRWGAVSWRTMAGTMIVVGFAVWFVWNSIAYTLGQFLEWSDGRYYAGVPVTGADGTISYEGARADAVRDSVAGKLGAGLLHGVLSSVASSVWCIAFGTVLIWLPARLRSGQKPPIG